MNTWLDANADGIALALMFALLGLVALGLAACFQWLADHPRGRGRDDTATRHRRITDRGRRTRAGIRETHR
jgi:hypothetical protein